MKGTVSFAVVFDRVSPYHATLLLDCLMRIFYNKTVENMERTISPPAHVLIAFRQLPMTLKKRDDLTRESLR